MNSVKEKAKELYNKFNPHALTKNFYGDDIEIQSTKICALLAVEEAYNALYNYLKDTDELQNADREFAYWEEVEKEIHNY